MRKRAVSLKLEAKHVDKIETMAVEGNVSQWIRLLIKKELEKVGDEECQTRQKE
jgi:hypothetical protein